MRARRGRVRRPFAPRKTLALLLSVFAVILVACSSKTPATTTSAPSSSNPGGGSSSSGTSGSSPGVTADSVTVGQVDDLSSPIPGLFKGAEDGTKAYFAYINSLGGVNGRMIKLDAEDSTFQGGAGGHRDRDPDPDRIRPGGRVLAARRGGEAADRHRARARRRVLAEPLARQRPLPLQPAAQPARLLPHEPLPVPEEEVPAGNQEGRDHLGERHGVDDGRRERCRSGHEACRIRTSSTTMAWGRSTRTSCPTSSP